MAGLNIIIIYHKLFGRGYEYNLLRKSIMIFINLYKVDIKYGASNHDNLFSQMLCFKNRKCQDYAYIK